MKWKRSCVLALFFAVITTVTAVRSQEAPLQYRLPLPIPVQLPIPLITQDTPVWCWVAAADMAIKYRRCKLIQLSQCQMLEIGYSLQPGFCCGDLRRCMRPTIGWNEIRSLIYHFGGTLSSWTLPHDPITLYNLLDNRIPVISQITTGYQTSHFVVIQGMYFVDKIVGHFPDGTPIVDRIAYVNVNDPLSPMTQVYSYPQLRLKWIDSLVIGFCF